MVTVIMSVYNESISELKQSINSILNQSYENIEFIIVLDNPLNYEASALLNDFKKNDKRIKIIVNKKNLGLIKSLNIAYKLANGEYIARMDADDIAKKARIEKELQYLKKNSLDLVAANRINIEETGKIISTKSKMPEGRRIEQLLKFGCCITHPTVLFKKEILITLDGYRDIPTAEDYDLWLRMITKHYKMGFLDEPLLFYRIRESSISRSNGYQQFLSNKYVKELYKQRKKTQFDNYSKRNYNDFLNKNGYISPKMKKSYQVANNKYNYALSNWKKGMYFKSLKSIFEAILIDRRMIRIVFNLLIFEILRWYYIRILKVKTK